MKTINKTNMNMSNEETKESIVKKYTPLVYKIASQIHKGTGVDMDDCISAGYEGLLHAIDTYKSDKQTFIQYSSYMIRFYIINDVNKHSRTIRVSWDQKKRAEASGKSVNLCVSIDAAARDDEDGSNMYERTMKGADEKDVMSSINPSIDDMWKDIFIDINDMFNERDKNIFFRTFGVNGTKECDCKTVAKEMGISPAAITQNRNKIIRKIKQNPALMEKLIDVMQMMNAENE